MNAAHLNSFMKHGVEELSWSACLLSHAEVVTVYQYFVLLHLKKWGGKDLNVFAALYASQSRKSKTSFIMAIVLEVSGMFGIACLTLAFCHQKLEQNADAQIRSQSSWAPVKISWQTSRSNKMLMLEKIHSHHFVMLLFSACLIYFQKQKREMMTR